MNGGFGEAALRPANQIEHLVMAKRDYTHETLDQLTSTPHQPANAGFAPSLLPNVGENGPMQVGKRRKIKGLPSK